MGDFSTQFSVESGGAINGTLPRSPTTISAPNPSERVRRSAGGLNSVLTSPHNVIGKVNVPSNDMPMACAYTLTTPSFKKTKIQQVICITNIEMPTNAHSSQGSLPANCFWKKLCVVPITDRREFPDSCCSFMRFRSSTN